jgi:16S rRNA processing protein RimM
MDDWIKVGKVGKSHGLAGEFFLSGRDEPFKDKISKVQIGKSIENSNSYEVEKISQQSGRALINLVGFKSRNDSEALLHQSVWALRSELTISEDEFYWDDLKDKPVELEDGTRIGKVFSFNNFGASDVVEIVNESKQSLMLPFVDQYFHIERSIDESAVILAVENDVIEDLWTGGKKKNKGGSKK